MRIQFLIIDLSFPYAPFLYPLETLKNSKGVEKGCIGNKWVKFVNLFLNLNLLIVFYSTWLYGNCMTIVHVRKKYFMDTFSLENLLKKTLVLISSTNQCDMPNVTVSGYMPIEFGYSMEL